MIVHAHIIHSIQSLVPFLIIVNIPFTNVNISDLPSPICVHNKKRPLHSCHMHIIVHVLTHTHPHTHTHIHITHHTIHNIPYLSRTPIRITHVSLRLEWLCQSITGLLTFSQDNPSMIGCRGEVMR